VPAQERVGGDEQLRPSPKSTNCWSEKRGGSFLKKPSVEPGKTMTQKGAGIGSIIGTKIKKDLPKMTIEVVRYHDNKESEGGRGWGTTQESQ